MSEITHLPLSDPSFAAHARRVRFLGIDFDGVMTDNVVYVFEDGREAVRCSRFEGFGLKRLKETGIAASIISTEANPVVAARAAKLKIDCHQNITDKVAALDRLLAEYNLSWEEAAFIGNDENDADVLARVGLPVLVADAHESLDHVRAYRTNRLGGNGAVRELCDAIVRAHLAPQE